MTKMNNNMKRWVKEEVEKHSEPFTSREIYEKVIDARGRNTHFITNVYSVGWLLNQICKKERVGKKNLYWRKENEN